MAKSKSKPKTTSKKATPKSAGTKARPKRTVKPAYTVGTLSREEVKAAVRAAMEFLHGPKGEAPRSDGPP